MTRARLLLAALLLALAAPLPASAADGALPQIRVAYDAAAGKVRAFTREGRERAAIDAPRGAIPLGEGADAFRIPPEVMAPFFDARDVSLALTVRAEGPGAGEMLRIHRALEVSVGRGGSLRVGLWTPGGVWHHAVVRRARIDDGAPHRIAIDYDAGTGELRVGVDGGTPAVAFLGGRTRPAEHWGLALGNPFGDRPTWRGEVSAFALMSRTAP
ncbi:hypothetical protein [Jannaschia sp. W003]|uniref:hypothetical protein n=1 Tax=Jannaschia sp. W003 TaxID=2867012 RepID=UPI0021A35BDC|nr:hypothetical protein [Jannaschia sp. W003]UWQ21852.1 hypothetical protein K3554_02140 [Jannaschia sp. W003]